ncbi:MAG: DUF6691 family protein [Oligoflexales bacterium]
MLFGIGWGIGGNCPVPAIAFLISLSESVFTFLISMVLSISVFL